MFWARRDRRLMIRTWSILENIESGAGRAASSSGLPARFFACLNRTDTTQRLIHRYSSSLFFLIIVTGLLSLFSEGLLHQCLSAVDLIIRI